FCSALADGPRALRITGEPGIGKTTIWRYALDRCSVAGFELLTTRPAEEEMPLALGALAELFPQLGDAPADDDVAFERGRAALAELRRHAVERPVVVAIDDTQWLDSASARALRYALRRIDRERVGVIATLRAGTGREDPLRGEDVLPPGRTDVLEPAPLTQDELRDVLAGTVAAISRPLL